MLTRCIIPLVALLALALPRSAAAVPVPGDLFVSSGGGIFYIKSSDGSVAGALNPQRTVDVVGLAAEDEYIYGFDHLNQTLIVFDHFGVLVGNNVGGPFTGNPACMRPAGSGTVYIAQRSPPFDLLLVEGLTGQVVGGENPPLSGAGIEWFDFTRGILYYTSLNSIRVRRWNMYTDTAMTDLATAPSAVRGLALVKNDSELLVLTSNELLRYDLQGNLLRTYPPSDFGSMAPLKCLAGSPTGEIWTSGPGAFPEISNYFQVEFDESDNAQILSTTEFVAPIAMTVWVSSGSYYSVPIFDHASGCGTTRNATAGDTLSFDVRIYPGRYTPTVTLSSDPLPGGASMSPPLPVTGPDQAASTFEWVPEEAQVGEHVLVFRGAGACSMWVQVESGLVSVPSAPVQSSFSIRPRQPSDPWVDLRFGLASAQQVHLRVLDVHGRELAVLSRTSWDAGSHQVRWNARDISARPGVYWIEFRTAVERRAGKIVLVH